jgi:transcriptional antiterminator
MDEKDFLKAQDIMELMPVSRSTAYRLIKEIQTELKDQGLIVISGIVPRRYFLKRMGVQ